MPGAGFPQRTGVAMSDTTQVIHIFSVQCLIGSAKKDTFCKPTLRCSPVIIAPYEELSGSLLCSQAWLWFPRDGFLHRSDVKGDL